ncbi:MAG: 30S ribosomal protein S15 [Clostridiales bacterium]|nr:30S ribosomal protein S15 [Clostridiales bacterium]
MISKEKKQEVIKAYATKEGDTGSCEVQIAILSTRINELTDHLKKNPNDNHSRRGLLKLVNRRKSLLKYMERTNLEGYRVLKSKLNIR